MLTTCQPSEGPRNDPVHPLLRSRHNRCSTPRRKLPVPLPRKRQLVRNLWLAAGLVTLLYPTVATLIVVGLLATFISFLILDETP
jgi:hypothetical protein